jgi:Fe-S oxidoreductase
VRRTRGAHRSASAEEAIDVETVCPFAEAAEEIGRAGADSNRLCYQCGKCDVYCPWNRVREFSIRRIVRESSFGLSEIESDDVWRCTTCGSCPAQCPRGVGQIEVSVALRRVASDYGVYPASVRGISAAKGSLATEGNPLGEKRSTRADWMRGLAVSPFEEGMDLLFFVGCYYAYDPRLGRVAAAAVDLLNRAGVSFGVLGTAEVCCGESVRKAGGEKVFKALARENIKTFIDRGVKRILVASPHCFHTFAREYPDFMVHFEVVHLTQLLEGLIREGRLALRAIAPRRVTYHDPCYLGRHNGVYDAPRFVLRSIPGLELVELPDARERSLCCGGGGGRIWADTPKGERFADLRLDQARAVGAEALVTACPYCVTNFEESRSSRADGDALRVMDVAELVREALAE